MAKETEWREDVGCMQCLFQHALLACDTVVWF